MYLADFFPYPKAMINVDEEARERLELASRINEAISSMPRGTKRILADKCGIAPAAVTGWSKTGRIDKPNIAVVASVTGYSLTWLITGKGEKTSEEEMSNIAPGPEIRGKVPLISSVPAGDFREAIDNLHPGDCERLVDASVPIGRHTFALRVDGDSMEPEFRHGDVIIVEPDMQAEHNDFVIAKNGGDATFKQLWKEGGEWYLKPLNDRYPIKPLGDSSIIGVVREKSKRYK